MSTLKKLAKALLAMGIFMILAAPVMAKGPNQYRIDPQCNCDCPDLPSWCEEVCNL